MSTLDHSASLAGKQDKSVLANRLVLMVLLANSCLAIVHVYRLLAYHVQATPWEEAIFLSATRFPTITQIYSLSNLQHPPYWISIYSPLYYAIVRGVTEATGSTMAVGRYLSTAGVIVVLAALFRPIRQQRFWSPSSFFPPLLFLSIFPTLCWSGSYFKPEFVAMPFSLLAFLSYVGKGLSSQRSWVLRTAALAATALLFKLTALGVLIGISGHLLWDKRYKDAIRVTACAVAIVLLVYAFLEVWMGSGIWTMGISGNAFRLSPHVIVDYLFNKYLANVLVLIAVVGCLSLLAGSGGKRSVESAIAFYFLASFAFFAFACGKPGSSHNYFVESAIGLALVVPAALHSLYLRREIQAYYMFAALLILALALNLKGLLGIIRWSSASIDHHAVQKTLSAQRIPSGTYVMADAHYVMDVVKSGHEPLINDNLLYSLMVINRKIPQGQVMEALTHKQVSYVLLAHPVTHYAPLQGQWWPPEVISYVEQNYTCQAIMGDEGDAAAVGCVPKAAAQP